MAEEQYVHSVNGEEVQQADINLMSSTGALADDHVLAELLRLVPYSGAVAKAILPYAHQATTTATVSSGGATGGVVVSPFRAIAGTRDTAANIGPRANWNDVRSGIFTGPTALVAALPLVANTSATQRWDLVYALLALDATGQTVNRYCKDPATELVSVVSVVRTKVQSVSVGVVQGTGAARPILPPDGPGAYYFPLAFVRVPAGFTATSIVSSTDIEEVLPVVPVSRVLGVAPLLPANHQNKPGGTVLGSTAFGWTSNRPGPYLPPTMVGGDSRLIALDLWDANSANWSHASGSVVDDSCDWRKRAFRSLVVAVGGQVGQDAFAWDRQMANGVFDTIPGAGTTPLWTVGQTFVSEVWAIPGNMGLALYVDPARLANLAPKSSVALYADAQGALRLGVSTVGVNNASPACRLFIWLEATAPFPNF